MRLTVACSEACTIAGTLRAGAETAEASGEVRATAGSARLTFRLSAKTLAALRKAVKPVPFALRLTVADAAGHTVRVSRAIRVLPE